jgi:hypothetical protein
MQNTDTYRDVWETVRDLNKSWTTKGNLNRLKDYFHETMVAVTPELKERITGKEDCFQGWKRFHDTVDILSWEEKDPLIRIYGKGQFAVIAYYYQISYQIAGKPRTESGRDLFVLIRENGKWLAVADCFSPFPS